MKQYVEWNGRMLPVTRMETFEDGTEIPVIEVTLMSGIKWQRGALEMRLKPPSPLHQKMLSEIDGDTDAAIARLEKWLKENDPDYEEWRKTL